MYKALFYLWTTGVTLIFSMMAFDASWTLYLHERVFPVDLAALEQDDKKASRRSESEQEELRRLEGRREEEEEEEEEDDDDEDELEDDLHAEPSHNGRTARRKLLPSTSANPFVPQRQELPAIPQIAVPTDSDHAAAARFDARDFDFQVFSADPDGVTPSELAHCKAVIERTLAVVPDKLTKSLDDMTLYFSAREPRGLSNSHVMELRCGELSDQEIVAVLVHELGHIADLGAFRGISEQPSGFVDGSIVIPVDDMSAEFYGISWRDAEAKKFSADRNDFISGYAMSDPFEDFAESFIAYILHGNDFRALATESSALQAKYDFLKQEVFDGAEYEGERDMKNGKRVWDITLVAYDLPTFWKEKSSRLAAAE